MNSTDNDHRDIVDDHLGLFRSPPAEEMAQAEVRVLWRLRSEAPHAAAPTRSSHTFHRSWRFALAGAAAAVVFAIAVGRPTHDVLFRVVEGDVHQADTLRSNGGGGAVLELADGSRVEMRSGSELSLARAADGLRILLNSGGIIVNAAKQRTGHLYVETRDVTVSVTGTVFLVNAEKQGSRVAVIEGEVRVRQGTNEKRLLPGDQVTSSPAMAAPPVRQVIAWSRNAATLDALLPPSAAVSPAVAVQNNAGPHFEVESIRPRPVSPGLGRSGSPYVSGLPPACGASLRIDPRRFAATNITVFELIAIAYEKDCLFAEESTGTAVGGVIGGPEWIRSARYDVEALRPEDPSDYTTRAYGGGGHQFTPGPKLRRMVQSMLAERFGLTMQRETREMAVYELVVARTGLKLPPQNDSKGFTSYVGGAGLYEAIKNSINPKPEYSGLIVGAISATGASMTDLAQQLTRLTGRHVLNRTGVEGVFTYEFFFAPAQWRSWKRDPAETRPHLTNPSLFMVLEEELGLRLEEVRRPIEVLTIERVERPTEN
ncbi:MAG: TIGR03435 family protein [Vicinamibacterales bacterium]